MNIRAHGEFKPEQLEHLSGLLRAVMDDTGRDQAKILRETGVSFARSAYERTPKGQKSVNVKVQNIPAGIKKKTGVWVWTWLKTETGEISRLPVPLTTAKEHGLTRSKGKAAIFHQAQYSGTREIVRNRGFARAGWIGIINQLGGVQTSDESAPDAETAKTFFSRVAEGENAVEIAQHTPPAMYQQAKRGIMERAMAVTFENLTRQLETHASKIKQRWQ